MTSARNNLPCNWSVKWTRFSKWRNLTSGSAPMKFLLLDPDAVLLKQSRTRYLSTLSKRRSEKIRDSLTTSTCSSEILSLKVSFTYADIIFRIQESTIEFLSVLSRLQSRVLHPSDQGPSQWQHYGRHWGTYHAYRFRFPTVKCTRKGY